MTFLRVCTVCLALGGCSLMPKPEAQVAIDTFCLQKKRTWSVNDSVETIREAEVWNGTIDRRCVKKGDKA
jgi:hypothetical protein